MCTYFLEKSLHYRKIFNQLELKLGGIFIYLLTLVMKCILVQSLKFILKCLLSLLEITKDRNILAFEYGTPIITVDPVSSMSSTCKLVNSSPATCKINATYKYNGY